MEKGKTVTAKPSREVMTPELKPCPFCGSRAEIKRGGYTQYVMCLGCEVMGPNLTSNTELIAAWNCRADPLLGRDAEWMPIESAPKDGTEVLIYGLDTQAVAAWDGDKWRDYGDIGWGGMQDAEPTHWRPLPAPPAGAKG